MRIEQYFLMTDYSLWEVILNGDSPAPTRAIEGVVQPVALTTAEQRLARKNELKARGTLLMALPDKHQLKFNIHKDAKTLMESIEKRFGGNKEAKKNKTDLEEQSLDDLFNNLKIYEAEVKSSSSASTSTQNIAFVSSSNTDSTNEPISTAAVSAKIPISALLNMDTLSNARTRRNLGANGPTSMGFDMSKVECYNYHRKGHFAKECRSPKDTRRNGLESVEARLLVYQQNESVFEEDIKLLKLEVQLRDNALVVLRQKFKKAEQERDDLKLKLEKYQSEDGYHAIPPPYTGTFMPPKSDLVFHNAPNVDETVHTAFNVELSTTNPDKDLSPTPRPLAPIIEDWISDSEDDSKAKIPHNAPSFVQPNE
nr:ribonuclease H-like domain-containing protein [Tanacetum cinerariifolium]